MIFQYKLSVENREVHIGIGDKAVASFRKAGFFVQHLSGTWEGTDYQFKLAAPWTGFRYRLRRGGLEMASAKKQGKMHAFEEDRPFVRHHRLEYAIDAEGRAYVLTAQDRFGLCFSLTSGSETCGRYAARPFDEQQGSWNGDFDVPDDWSVPLVAFVVWVVREGVIVADRVRSPNY